MMIRHDVRRDGFEETNYLPLADALDKWPWLFQHGGTLSRGLPVIADAGQFLLVESNQESPRTPYRYVIIPVDTYIYIRRSNEECIGISVHRSVPGSEDLAKELCDRLNRSLSNATSTVA